MKGGIVQRDDYVIAFGGDDPTNWHYEVEGEPFIDGLRHYLNTEHIEFPSGNYGVSIDGDVYDGTELAANMGIGIDGPDMAAPRDRRVFLSHLWVDPPFRRESIGSFFFDAFKSAAAFRGGEAAGRIGGGEETAEFFAAEGVPRDAISVPSAKRAKFSVTVDRLMQNDSGMAVSD